MRLRFGLPMNIDVLDLDGRILSFDRPMPDNVQVTSVGWSPDGKELAFFANGPGPVSPVLLHGWAAAEVFNEQVSSLENPAHLYRLNLERRTIQQVDTGEIDLGQLGAPKLDWTSANELVLRAPRRKFGYSTLSPASRGPLWGHSSGNAEPWFGQVKAPLEWFFIDQSGKIRSDGSGATDASATSPDGEEAADRAKVAKLVQAPTPKARLVAYSRPAVSGIFLQNDRSGTFLWRGYLEGGKTELLFTANTYRARILKSERTTLEYTSLNQDALKAALYLPPGHVPGRRYPLVVAIYPGLAAPKEDPDAAPGSDIYPSPGGPDLYVAAGYAFLKPSMLPMNNLPGLGGEEGWSMLMFIHATMPAIEKAIQQGVVDPDRIFLTGTSGGGWATMATLTQTTRFRAAMAEAAGGNGKLTGAGAALGRSVVNRYRSVPHDWNEPNGIFKGFYPSDVPWWRDGDRRTRNDPLTYVDRVGTPLLIMHGDLDAIPIELSEEFFNALASMRKPAEFVRYWGEGHVNKNLANRRDQLQRTLAWFERWGDIARDTKGEIIFEGDRAKSRNGAQPLNPGDFAKFPLFEAGGDGN